MLAAVVLLLAEVAGGFGTGQGLRELGADDVNTLADQQGLTLGLFCVQCCLASSQLCAGLLLLGVSRATSVSSSQSRKH